MDCIRCGKETPEPDKLFCSVDCEMVIALKLEPGLTTENFRQHEAGEIVGEENMEFLGRITRAGLVEHLNKHYKSLTADIRRCGIMREDGSIDIEHYRQIRKSHDQQEHQRHSH